MLKEEKEKVNEEIERERLLAVTYYLLEVNAT